MTSQAQLKLMLAGGLAGAAAKTCTAPLGRLTILYQLKAFEGTQPSVWKGLKYIVEKQGFTGLWRGHAATLLHRMPYSAVNFAVFENTRNLLTPILKSSSEGGTVMSETTRYLIAGGAGGSVGCAVAYPLDLVKTKLTADLSKSNPRYSGVLDCASQILRREGIRGLYKGLGATLLQVTPTLAVNFTAYEMSKSFLSRVLGVPGGFAGQRATVQAHPHPDVEHVALVAPASSEDAVNMRRQWRGSGGGEAGVVRPGPSGGRGVWQDGVGGWKRSPEPATTGPATTGTSTRVEQLERLTSEQFTSTSRPSSSSSSVGGSNGTNGKNNFRASTEDRGRGRGGSAVPHSGSSAVQAAAVSRKEAFRDEAIASKAVISLVAGSFSGVVSSTLTFPLDVIRRNLQANNGLPETYMQNEPFELKFEGALQVVHRLYADAGWRAFYKGLLPEYLKVIPSVSIAFCCYEMLRSLLDV